MPDESTGAATFLFTDLEDSTSLWERHPDAMRSALARHDSLLRTVVESQSGEVVKTTGDGVHAVFATAHDAVLAAANGQRAIQAEPWPEHVRLRVRIGVHTGDAEYRDGDYFGSALNRAARLMSAAHGNQVVVSGTTADLVRDGLPDGLALVDLGEHRLRGLTHPEHAFQLTIRGLDQSFPPLRSDDAFPGDVGLPIPQIATGRDSFTGRDRELTELDRAWAESAGGASRIVFVGGEPGIGKTRLSSELARRVHAEGSVVLYGRCEEEAIVPYQPFVEALRPYVAACSVGALRERLHGLEVDLARFFPELRAQGWDLAAPIAGEPETERYRLFEAFTTLLTGITATRPTLVMLDDLHWADRPTLLLLRHLARNTAQSALMLLGTYRDVELARDHPFADLIADLSREPNVARLALKGLSAPEAAGLLGGLGGRALPPALVDALHRETGGSPFFLEELLRHLQESGTADLDAAGAGWDVASLGLPQGVRDVVMRRVRRLPADVGTALGVAAVVGLEFDVPIVASAASRPVPEVLALLDQAAAAGFVIARDDARGRYGFSHALLRQTLESELGPGELALLHAKVGAAMEASGERLPAALLAHHFERAISLGDATKAIEYIARAGSETLAEYAFEDAAAYFERAIALVEAFQPDEARRRVELLISLTDALLYVSQHAAVEAGRRAVEAARSEGSPDLFARAVIAIAVQSEPVGRTQLGALFDEALAMIGDDEPEIRGRLLARQAFRYASYNLVGRNSARLTEEALRYARGVEDPITVAEALGARVLSLEGTPHLEERRALGEELVAMGDRVRGKAPTYGWRTLAGVALEQGDPTGLARAAVELGRVGDVEGWLPAKVYALQWSGTIALLEGRFDDASNHVAAMLAYAEVLRDVVGLATVQTFYLAREQGREANVSGMEMAAQAYPDSIYVQAMLAVTQLDVGDVGAARDTLDVAAARGFGLGTESGSTAALALFAEVASGCRAPDHAEALTALLDPFRGRLLSALLGLACLGAADRHLGMLATVLERWDAAEEHFRAAEALEDRVGGAALLTRTRYWHAHLLAARGRVRGTPADGDAARRRSSEVAAAATALGMARLAEQAAAVGREG